MPYIPMTDYDSAPPEVRAEYDDQIAKHGRITNMKRTLLQHVPSFRAYMEWYTLYDELKPVIGDRALSLFSYAISNGNHCLICSTFFRKGREKTSHHTLVMMMENFWAMGLP